MSPENLENRLRRLESTSGKECTSCGFDGDYRKIEMQVNVRGLGASEPTSGPDRCLECGRVLVVRVPGLVGRNLLDGNIQKTRKT